MLEVKFQELFRTVCFMSCVRFLCVETDTTETQYHVTLYQYVFASFRCKQQTKQTKDTSAARSG